MTQAATETESPAPPWVPDDSTLGARLALIRQRMGWNITEAAKACGVPPENWRLWEAGRQPRNFITMAMLIAGRTGCDLDWLVYGQAKRLMQPSQSGRQVNVDYPQLLRPVGERVIATVSGGAEIRHGDGRKRQPFGRSTAGLQAGPKILHGRSSAPAGRVRVP